MEKFTQCGIMFLNEIRKSLRYPEIYTGKEHGVYSGFHISYEEKKDTCRYCNTKIKDHYKECWSCRAPV